MFQIVSYNILSQDLAKPSYYSRCLPAFLKDHYRFSLVAQMLEKAVMSNAVICLQEVCQGWAGRLHDFFVQRNYVFVWASAGRANNGFMGVAVAYPWKEYECFDVKIVHVGGHIPRPPLPSRTPSVWRSALALARLPFSMLQASVLSLGAKMSVQIREWKKRREFNPREYAKSCTNAAIFLRLTPRGADLPINIGTYHMPCAFWALEVMRLHTEALLKTFENYIQEYPQQTAAILLGDFNTKPENPAYKLIRERGWLDAYTDTNAGEIITNRAAVANPFVGCIDYIFYRGLSCVTALQLPEGDDYWPSASQPSDHAMLGASFVEPGNARSTPHNEGSEDQTD